MSFDGLPAAVAADSPSHVRATTILSSRACFVMAASTRCAPACSDRPRLAANGHRPLHDLLGIGVAALIPVETGEVIQNTGEIRMIGTEGFLESGRRPLEQPLGLG